jgi:hypothetical protein
MRLGKAVGWGIVIYAIMFMTWNAFVIYGFVDGILPRLTGLAVLIAVSTIAGRSLGFASVKDVLPYALTWAVIVALLDIVYSIPFTGWQLYADWNVWVGYLLVLGIPLLAPYTRSKPQSPPL